MHCVAQTIKPRIPPLRDMSRDLLTVDELVPDTVCVHACRRWPISGPLMLPRPHILQSPMVVEIPHWYWRSQFLPHHQGYMMQHSIAEVVPDEEELREESRCVGCWEAYTVSLPARRKVLYIEIKECNNSNPNLNRRLHKFILGKTVHHTHLSRWSWK